MGRSPNRTAAPVAVTLSERTPLWAILMAGVLYATGFVHSDKSNRLKAPRVLAQGQLPPRRTTLESESRSEAGRGRQTDKPTEIPPRGWKDIALRVYRGIGQDRVLAIAAGVTFYVLLALFPGIAGLIALYGLYADAGTISQHLDTLAGVLPEGGLEIIREQIQRLTAQPPQRLGVATFVGLAISLWSANGGMKAIFDALNVVYHEREKRGFIRLNAVSLAFTLGAIVFILIALSAMTVLPAALSYFGLSQVFELLIKIGRWPFLLVIVSLAIALIYRFGPSRDPPKWRWITPGSVAAAVGWLGASLLFSWYTENFGSYNKTYGSLGAVIGFMAWLWLSNILILVGAKLNAETEHQTARDSTRGEPEPLGNRGAVMADTVGHAQTGS